MSKCKTKAIQTDFGSLRHNQVYPRIIEAYSKPCVTLPYLEPWRIQNPDISQTRNIFRTQVYSEFWHIQNPRLIRISTTSNIYNEGFCKNSRKQFRSISLPRSLHHEVVTPEVKNYGTWGGGDLEFFKYLLIHSNKLTYLQLITVLVYENSSPESHEQGYLNFQLKILK